MAMLEIRCKSDANFRLLEVFRRFPTALTALKVRESSATLALVPNRMVASVVILRP